MEDSIREELNVKNVCYKKDLSEFMNYEVKPNFKEVGKIFGRNHSTVNSSLKNVQQRMSTDSKYKNLINDIINPQNILRSKLVSS